MTVLVERTFTDLLRHSGEVADLAERQDVRISRRDASDLLLSSYEREEGIRESLRLLAGLLTGAARRSELAHDIFVEALLDQAAWTSFLPRADREQFVNELTRTAAACVEAGVFSPLGQLLHEWHATAAVHADPDIVAYLNRQPAARPVRVQRP